MRIIDAIDKNEVIALIDQVSNSTEDKWVKFRADKGSKGVTEYILDRIERMPSTPMVSVLEVDDHPEEHKRCMGGFNPW